MKNPTITDIGCDAKDVVTKFTGTITGFARYITGCDQFLVSPPIDAKGKHVDARWFDQNRLELAAGKRVEIDTVEMKGPGAPAPIK